MKLVCEISQVRPFISWPYFFHAWQLHGHDEQQQLRQEAEARLDTMQGRYHTYALFQLLEAVGDGDDILVVPQDSDDIQTSPDANGCLRIPLLRQQTAGSDFLCLADFLSPVSDKIGVFATSVDHGLETDFDADPYEKMMHQLLADRLAEATAEWMHCEIRRHYWGYAPDEQLPISEMLLEHFQGIRPAVGYPSMPDTSLNFVIDSILDFRQIGIRLTESGAMRPHASVSGLMIAHPAAHYFAVGKIGEDQLRDYAQRRGLPIEVCRKFLASNL